MLKLKKTENKAVPKRCSVVLISKGAIKATMKEADKIKKLIEKYVRNQCDEKELELLFSYFKQAKSAEVLPKVDELDLLLKEGEWTQDEVDKVYANIKKQIRKHDSSITSKGRLRIKIVRYAAIFIALLGVVTWGYWQITRGGTNPQKVIQSNQIVSTPKSIQLKLGNGTVKMINVADSTAFKDKHGIVIGHQKGEQLTYQQKKYDKLVYNTLIVPYGKKFKVELSDGTWVHMNSGSSLRYPVAFIEGQKRQVYLEGEAYFDVAKDKKHPFIVHVGKLNVEVYGTEFDVLGYKELPSIAVVLVEGSVGMYSKNEKEKIAALTPGVRGSYNKQTHTISKKNVRTSLYTAWMDGEMVFRNMEFKNILMKLERHYNVTIINKNKALEESRYSANFGDEPIEKVLAYLKASYNINYTINNGKIIIE